MIDSEVLAPLLERVCRSHCWKVAQGSHPTHINEPLSAQRVALHLSDGGLRHGVCPIEPGTRTVRMALLDMDSHKGEVTWSQMREHARELIDALAEQELYAIPFRSSGGNGIHLIVLFNGPQDAYSVREALKLALTKCNLANGTGGLAEREVEIFPKQNAVPADGFGNMFVLPLAGHSCALNPDTLADIVPGLIRWRASDDVPVREQPPRPERIAPAAFADHKALKSALDAIPNHGDEELCYDEWRNVVFALHDATSGDDVGHELAHEFSARCDKYDPDFLDTRVWPYVRDRADKITVRTIYSIASRYGWQDPTLIDDFEVIESVGSVATQGAVEDQPAHRLGKFHIELASDFIEHGHKPDIVKGVLPRAGLVVLFGESTAGKTFVALDLAGSVARGDDWRGLKTRQGRVLYICAEGAGGFRKRLRAYMRHHDLHDIPIDVLAAAPNFMKVDDIRELLLAAIGCGPYLLIIIDTFAQVMPGANENSGEDVGMALQHCRVLHEKTHATVMLVHHSGKDASKGARGWSGLRAAADGELEVTRFNQDRAITVTKLKDGEDGVEMPFRLQTVVVGEDEDGDVISSCIVTHANGAVARQRRRLSMGPAERPVFNAVRDLIGVDGGAVPVAQVLDEAVGNMPADLVDGKRDTRRQRAFRMITKLAEKGFLVITDNAVNLPSEQEYV